MDGRVLRGVPVFELAYRAVGLGWLMAPVKFPPLRALADRLHPWIARNRHPFPRTLVTLAFETGARRAAERAAARRCQPEGECRT